MYCQAGTVLTLAALFALITNALCKRHNRLHLSIIMWFPGIPRVTTETVHHVTFDNGKVCTGCEDAWRNGQIALVDNNTWLQLYSHVFEFLSCLSTLIRS